LSAFRYANAEGFFRTVEERPEYPDIALYHAAISIELALSSYLLHVGFDDCWNCRNIRHDLDKALAYADEAGLGFISTELAWAVSILSPYYKRHGIDELARDPDCPISVIGARRIVRCLLSAVRDATGHRPPRIRKFRPTKAEATRAEE
jgi:hypothetical protein